MFRGGGGAMPRTGQIFSCTGILTFYPKSPLTLCRDLFLGEGGVGRGWMGGGDRGGRG